MTFEQHLVSEYFKHSSIDQVFKVHNYDLPISFAGYHRVLNKFRIVKSAGPNSKLSESLELLSLINTYKLPLERIYHHHAPVSIQISTNTMHRILHHIRLGVTRRIGTALIITNPKFPNQYLLGQDQSLTKSNLGRKGDWSLPMGYTREQDTHQMSIKRVLQQEVFTHLAIENKFPKNIIPQEIKEIFTLNLADIKVYVYHLEISQDKFSSFKLTNHQFHDLNQLKSLKVRPGVLDILEHFENQNFDLNHNSSLNLSLAYAPVVE